jgi:RIO kinase 2
MHDFRVLEAVEKGMNKHALVPAPMIASLSNLRNGGTGKVLGSLLRDKLLSHDKSCGYDGYRLTNAGYDILALNTLKQGKFIAAVGDPSERAKNPIFIWPSLRMDNRSY